MNIRKMLQRPTSDNSSGYPHQILSMIFLILVLFFLPSCVEKKMSLREAKQVTVDMSEKSLATPPRRIGDILAVFDQTKQLDPDLITKMETKLNEPPPDTDNPDTLASFYFERGKNARDFGFYKQWVEDLRKASSYSQGERILLYLADAEANCGNFNRAIAAMKRSLEKGDKAVATKYRYLAILYFAIGDFKTAEIYTKDGIRYCNRKLSISGLSTNAKIYYLAEKALLNAELLDSKGYFIEAEPYRRDALEYLDRMTKNQNRKMYFYYRCSLAMNLANQGRLIDAELEVRDTLKRSMDWRGNESDEVVRIVLRFAEILLMQGRLDDAEKLIKAGTYRLETSGISKNSYWFANSRILLGKILVATSDFSAAMKQFSIAKKGFHGNKINENLITGTPEFIISLLKTGHNEEALELINGLYDKYREHIGEKNFRTAEMLALRAMAFASMKKEKEALKDFSASVPILFNDRINIDDYLGTMRLRIIIDTYIDLLMSIHNNNREGKFDIDAVAEIFRMLENLNGSNVQSALHESVVRATALEPELANLVRKEQDIAKQINALKKTISNVLLAPLDQQKPEALKNLKEELDIMVNARDVLLDEIQERFPKYSDFTKPKSVSFSVIKNLLRSEEVLISIYPTANRTYVWTIPPKGEVKFYGVPLGQKALVRAISHLRKSLEIAPNYFGDIPEFDLKQAYDIYSRLLEPAKGVWKDAKDLVVVAPGALGQLPLAVLPTAPIRFDYHKKILFAKYRDVPWLIRKVSITRIPSASAFVSLRKFTVVDSERRTFLGFGDPFFSRDQFIEAKSDSKNQKNASSNINTKLHVRGIRISEVGRLDSNKITSSKLGQLNRLPDTAEEILSIGKALGADLSSDIFLGKQASESQVKKMDLSNRKIVAFATHALIPGDLDGLDQPALALSAPSLSGESEDGLLKMGEILKLKLNADWVVLSACNTGAAEGKGAEAISGLGRAFFYAGTRAILVSMWPVETTSARELTTGLFSYLQADRTLSRAQALKKSALELIDGPGFKDKASGQIVASYAHPFFWAPFIVVGESGENAN